MSSTFNNYDRLRNSWAKMHIRCTDKNYHAYNRYGGRGIVVCERWKDFNTFRADMEATWYPGATLDRINNDGNYEPANCRWLPKEQNSRSRVWTPDVMLEMLRLSEQRLPQRLIAQQYNTVQSTVSQLIAIARKGPPWETLTR